MDKRIELQQIFEDILGSRNVYFQPPASVMIQYPAIVYELADIERNVADNQNYTRHRGYTITLIDKNPESQFIDKLLDLKVCRFDRHMKVNNLNHYVFSLYF